MIEIEMDESRKKNVPLANRFRPKNLSEFVGQKHIIGEGQILFKAITNDKLMNMILYGPPGTGKTTLAMIIAEHTKSNFVKLNATFSGIKEIRTVVEEANNRIKLNGRRTILFIDEIHRFNKGQQDALLPYTEDGTLIFIGATTENPYFEVNNALISRSIVFELKPLDDKDMIILIKNVLADKENGLGKYDLSVTDEAMEFLAQTSGGDARIVLNNLELCLIAAPIDENAHMKIDLELVEKCIQHKKISYDKSGDNHYDVISAFIKSMRGSDPDAAVHYLARMIEAGEDPVFIARRIVICASEDVGNADPHALQIAVAAANAVKFVGFPEARIILAQAVIYISCAPKSNSSYLAIDNAINDVRTKNIGQVPIHLRDSHYKGAEKLQRGTGYKYAHDYENHYVNQQYLPDELVGTVYYNPTENGVEKRIKQHMENLKGSSKWK